MELINAVRRGDVEEVQLVLLRGADVDEVGCQGGSTALHEACSEGQLEMAQTLLRVRANPNHARQDGNTPLHLAARFKQVRLVQDLLAAGADPNQCNDEGSTALHEAALTRRTAIVRALLDAGANPDAADCDGRTPEQTARDRGFFADSSQLFEDAKRPRILTVRAALSSPTTVELTCTTMGGDVAARLVWQNEEPASNLAPAVVEAVKRSGFSGFKALGVWNLRLLKPDGGQLNFEADAPSLAAQFGLA